MGPLDPSSLWTGDPDRWTIACVAAELRNGTLTPVDLLNECLNRIDRYEPQVRAWVHVDRDGAREQAERLMAEHRAGTDRGPLHGIPVGIKDIIDVFDLPTACGSALWANSVARHDAACVEALRDAGAVILGKTVTTAFAFIDPPVTRNPWDLGRTPGGSSSGSAAAVACGMVFAALGTQTGGSVTRPAAYCGVCSVKPTFGSISVEGVLPFAPSLDHVGVMARSVTDLSLVLEPLIGCGNARDTWPLVPALTGRKASTGRPVRLGRLRGRFDEFSGGEVDGYLNRFAGPGIEVIDIALPAAFNDVWTNHRALMAVQAAHYHGDRRRRRPDDYPPRITALIEEGERLGAPALLEGWLSKDHLRKLMEPMFGEVDALLTAAAPGPAPKPDTTGDPVFNAPWSFLGFPTVSFPVGEVGGLPIAVQLIGPWKGEHKLIAVAERCEEENGWNPGWPPEVE